MSKEYKIWTQEETDKLLNLYLEGMHGLVQLALMFKTTPKSITRQLECHRQTSSGSKVHSYLPGPTRECRDGLPLNLREEEIIQSLCLRKVGVDVICKILAREDRRPVLLCWKQFTGKLPNIKDQPVFRRSRKEKTLIEKALDAKEDVKKEEEEGEVDWLVGGMGVKFTNAFLDKYKNEGPIGKQVLISRTIDALARTLTAEQREAFIRADK